LDDYYRSRDAMPESPREAMPAILDQLALVRSRRVPEEFRQGVE
jgi:hypothetical protein